MLDKITIYLLIGILSWSFFEKVALATIQQRNIASLLSYEEMMILYGSSVCDDECPSTGNNVCYICLCYGESGDYIECSAYKNFDLCKESTTGPGCQDTTHLCDANGTKYDNREFVAQRRCNGASYCPITNWRGLDPIGSAYCSSSYTGCN